MIDEATDGYYVTVNYPECLDWNDYFKKEIIFRANSVYRVWVDVDEDRIFCEVENYSKAKQIELDFQDVIKRFSKISREKS